MWYEVITRDETLLSGDGVWKLIVPLVRKSGVEWVVSCDLLGAFTGLRDMDGMAIGIQEFENRVRDAQQYDWAFFFFFACDKLRSHEVLQCGAPLDNIRVADFSVRLVDDADLYIYCQDYDLAVYACETFASCRFREVNSAAELTIPY